MNIYTEKSYKIIIKQALIEKKERISKRFTYEKMAQTCGIQKTYLSRVLNSKSSHLNESQLYQAGVFLGMTKDERDYLQLLLRLDKATAAGLKEELGKEVETLQRKNLKTDSHISVKPSLSQQTDFTSYYLEPLVMLVHVFMTVDRFRMDPPTMAKTLQIGMDRLGEVLTKLETAGLVRLKKTGYEVLTKKTHLPSDSPLYKPFRTLQRLRTIDQLDKLPEDKAYSFSVAFSSNNSVRDRILRQILQLIGETEKLVSSSSEKEVYQLNIDLFDWS